MTWLSRFRSFCDHYSALSIHYSRRLRALCTHYSVFSTHYSRRFCADQRGQGLLLAAASVVVLAGFAALVLNVGTAVERRTRVQLAADAAAYSAANVLADSVSAIGWINSAMAQIYYNAQRYAVDVNVTGVAAVAEMRLNPGVDPATLQSVQEHRKAYDRATEYIPEAKAWLVDLCRIENAIAILAPRLMEEEALAAARRAGAERVSIFPRNRLFPLQGSTLSYRIERFEQGWRITNIAGGDGEMLYVRLEGDTWRIEYSANGVVTQEVTIRQVSATEWRIAFYEPPGVRVEEVCIVRTDTLGWVVWGASASGGTLPALSFEPVDMDGDGTAEGTKVTYNNVSQVLRRSDDNNLYVWDNATHSYVNMTSSQTEIAGVKVNVNVSNELTFPGGARVRIGDPTHVDIGQAHITLTDPPVIGAHLGPVWLSIHGFNPDDFSLTVGDFSLTRNDGDGRWIKHFDREEEYWWRQRLTEQTPAAPAVQQWQYDREVIGAMMKYDAVDRFVAHMIEDRNGANNAPDWTAWFNTATARPLNEGYRHSASDFEDPDPSTGIRQLRTDRKPPENAFYITCRCNKCNGTGKGEDGSLGGCPVCKGRDHDRNKESDIRIFIAELNNPDTTMVSPEQALAEINNICDRTAGRTDTDFLWANIYTTGYGKPTPRYPLVLAPEFFQYGVNVGVWRDSDKPLLFAYSSKRQRAADGVTVPGWSWGYVATAAARVSVPGAPWPFPSKFDREEWCDTDPINLYVADIRADLLPVRSQVMEYDLDRETLQGDYIGGDIDESATSYLLDAVLGIRERGIYEAGNWVTEYDGRSDPRVNALIRNMLNRSGGYYEHPGARFDFGSAEMDSIVLH